jgi:hypothetical protein
MPSAGPTVRPTLAHAGPRAQRANVATTSSQSDGIPTAAQSEMSKFVTNAPSGSRLTSPTMSPATSNQSMNDPDEPAGAVSTKRQSGRQSQRP